MNAKVLVVDDNPELLEIISMILTHKGFEVATTNKEDSIEYLLNSFSPDVMLLDVKFNGINGRTLCKEIKQKANKDIPTILISANPELLKDYKDYLAVDAMEKPFDISTITEKINLALLA